MTNDERIKAIEMLVRTSVRIGEAHQYGSLPEDDDAAIKHLGNLCCDCRIADRKLRELGLDEQFLETNRKASKLMQSLLYPKRTVA